MGPYQRTPKEGARAIRYSGLGVHAVGPVGDFLEKNNHIDIYSHNLCVDPCPGCHRGIYEGLKLGIPRTYINMFHNPGGYLRERATAKWQRDNKLIYTMIIW